MKKFVSIVILLTLCLCLTCCNRHNTHVTPTATTAKVVFVVSEAYADAQVPAEIEVVVGKTAGDLALPDGAQASDEYHLLQWYYDAECTNPYDAEAAIEHDTTLYLGEGAKSYTITYIKHGDFAYTGTLPDTYTYGEAPIALPKIQQKGYYDTWYCAQVDAMCVAVPTQAGCNLTFEAPIAIPIPVPYRYGVAEGETVNNPNPLTISIGQAAIELKPITCAGKQFDYWALRLTTGTKSFNGVQYTDGQRIDNISYEMVTSGLFALEAIWQK